MRSYTERRAYFRTLYIKNRERILARNKQWGKTNRDKTRAANRRMFAKMTTEERSAYWRRIYWLDPQRSVDRQKTYAQRHPDRVNHRVRAREIRQRGVTGSHTLTQWLARVNYFGWRCVYCNLELCRRTLTKDHVVPLAKNGPNWASNLVPACRSCNSRKGTRERNRYLHN